MAFVGAKGDSLQAQMNITPLVDVMLVLLVIFMVTMPLATQRIAIDLPQPAPTPPRPVLAQPIDLRINAEGQVSWNGTALPLSALESVMAVEAERYANPGDQPVLRIDVDREARYDALATVLAASRDAGLVRIGFVEPGQR